MGPGSFDPGSTTARQADRGENRRFNGAGVFRPRKSSFCLLLDGLGLVASMGPGSFDPGSEAVRWRLRPKPPLQWGRGLSTPEVPLPASKSTDSFSGFNGAGVFRPRKWCRNLQSGVFGNASMGPGSFDPGSGILAHKNAQEKRLQWGRGLSTPEVIPRRVKIESQKLLQWGRGLSTPEVREALNRGLPATLASMGPGSFDPGSENENVKERNSKHASMGPGSFDPGS